MELSSPGRREQKKSQGDTYTRGWQAVNPHREKTEHWTLMKKDNNNKNQYQGEDGTFLSGLVRVNEMLVIFKHEEGKQGTLS